MSFRKELRVIPRNTWIVTFVLYICLAVALYFIVPVSGAQWPRGGQLAFTFLMPLAFFLLVPLYGYIYGDAKRRAMRYVMWTLLAIFVPDFIGVIIYFILRDPLPIDCPSCHSRAPAKFTFCPQCGSALCPYCPQCGKSVERVWANCGHCGTKLPAS
ncbi:MAG: zinc ribbon domain-containing protein [Candidatus Acidiferrales bacterium]